MRPPKRQTKKAKLPVRTVHLEPRSTPEGSAKDEAKTFMAFVIAARSRALDKRRTIVGLETLMKFCEKNPKAKAAMDALVDACGGIFAKMEMEIDKPESAHPEEKQP